MHRQNSNIFRNTPFFRNNSNHTKHWVHMPEAAKTKTTSNPYSTSKSNLVQQSIESSNKLDELLKKCQQIGSSASSSPGTPKPFSVPIQNVPVHSNFTKISNYKLVKHIKSPNMHNHVQKISFDAYEKTSRFKLVKPKTIKINLNSLINQNIVNFRPRCTKYKISKQSMQWQAERKNKFKLRNARKILSRTAPKNRFKLVNNQQSPLNKYKLINSINLNRTRNETNKKIILANNLINRSKLTINRTIRKCQTLQSSKKNTTQNKMSLNNKVEKKYCLFYNRFGRCSRGEICPYIHDPNRVSLCPRFLRGTCKVKNCPFSHDTSPEKIPVCSFFASGCCNRENCPYQHIFYGKDAKFCIDFAKGHCPLGSKCDKLHLIECPEFEKDKKCPRGKKCPLLHRKKKTHQKPEKNQNENETLSFVPDFKSKNSENIKIFESKESKTDSNETFKLRPSFNLKKPENSK